MTTLHNSIPFDALDALFLIRLIHETDKELANHHDQQFLDDLADDIYDGRVHLVTKEEKTHLYRCAHEVGITWVEQWK